MSSALIHQLMVDPEVYCEHRGWACEPVLRTTESEQLASVVGWISEKPLQILVIIVVAFVANWALRRLITRTAARMMANADRLGGHVPAARHHSADTQKRSAARTATISSLSGSLASAVVILVALTSVLSVLGVSVAALFASAGIAGVALGFGAQNLVRDVLAGWFIVVEDRYGVGDTIDVGAPVIGVVERITLRSTRLRDLNGTVWHVANGEILQVGNLSQNWSRAVIDVVVATKADIDAATELLAEIGREMVREEPWSHRITAAPNVLGVQKIHPTGITLRVVCDTEPASQFQVEREYRVRVIRAFEAAGIPLAETILPVADPGA